MADLLGRRLFYVRKMRCTAIMRAGHGPKSPAPALWRKLGVSVWFFLQCDRGNSGNMLPLRGLRAMLRLRHLRGQQRLRQRPSLPGRLVHKLHIGQPMRRKWAMHDAGGLSRGPLHVLRR
jgi:hypothetical protein